MLAPFDVCSSSLASTFWFAENFRVAKGGASKGEGREYIEGRQEEVRRTSTIMIIAGSKHPSRALKNLCSGHLLLQGGDSFGRVESFRASFGALRSLRVSTQQQRKRGDDLTLKMV
jgi:hypothetical protein